MTRRHARRLGLAVIVAITASVFPPAARAQTDVEQRLGQETYDELKARREIIGSSPLYDHLTPISTILGQSAEPRYGRPFKFYLVHEGAPNAFSVPGGNVYVTDELLYFVRNREELAGTLCHELAHTIAHDSMRLLQKEEQIARGGVGAAILLGPTRARLLAIALIGKLRSLSYSRDVESAADLSGADICGASGANPWGLVWLLEDFERTDTAHVPQMLSNHPDNLSRVAALKRHFQEKPEVFGSFSPDRSRSRALAVPKDAPVVFVR